MVGIEKLLGIKSAIKKLSITGVVTKQANDVKAVMLIDRGILPLAKRVKIFDVAPPGIAAIIAMPMTMPGERFV